MKLKLSEIEIFRCGQLQPVDNHQSTASWGLRPRRLARSARPRTLRVLPTRHPPQTNAPTAHELRAAKRRAQPLSRSTFPPTVRTNGNSPLLSNESTRRGRRATGEESSPVEGPLRLIGRSPDAPIGISQGGGEGEETYTPYGLRCVAPRNHFLLHSSFLRHLRTAGPPD
jgi:hypothetical protein